MDETSEQNIYQHILGLASRRLEQAIPGSEGAFGDLSLAAVLNLLFLMRGEWGSIGDYVRLHLKALTAVIGDDLLWAKPQVSSPGPTGLPN